jgi:hypothetical protein
MSNIKEKCMICYQMRKLCTNNEEPVKDHNKYVTFWKNYWLVNTVPGFSIPTTFTLFLNGGTVKYRYLRL